VSRSKSSKARKVTHLVEKKVAYRKLGTDFTTKVKASSATSVWPEGKSPKELAKNAPPSFILLLPRDIFNKYPTAKVCDMKMGSSMRSQKGNTLMVNNRVLKIRIE